MKLGTRRITLSAIVAIVCLLPIPFAAGQAQDVPMAEEVWPSLQVLRGIPVDEFWDTMGMFASGLGKDCTDCHDLASVDNWEAFAIDTPMLRTARGMVRMMNQINNEQFGGVRVVTCFTCHRNQSTPEVVPDLSLQYGVPIENPTGMTFYPSSFGPTAEEVLDGYIQAIGGTERLTGITSLVARGTYLGYETGHIPVPIEISVEPNRRAIVKGESPGTLLEIYDGQIGWIENDDFPIPVMELSGGNLEGAKLESLLFFPAELRNAFNRWGAGITIIEDRDYTVVQGNGFGEHPVKFFFGDSGMLERVVYWTETVLGVVPVQLELSDYREVSGVMMPHRIVKSWTTGQIEIDLTEVETNVSLDEARFVRPPEAE